MSQKVFIFDLDGTITNENCLEFNDSKIEEQIKQNEEELHSYQAQLNAMQYYEKTPENEKQKKEFQNMIDYYKYVLNYYEKNKESIVDKKNYTIQLLNKILENGDRIYIVTTRPYDENQKGKPENIIKTKIFEDGGIDPQIVHLIKQVVMKQFDVKSDKNIYKLNFDPETRWLYFFNRKDFKGHNVKICNELKRIKIFSDLLREKFPHLEVFNSTVYKSSNEINDPKYKTRYGGHPTGIIKMLQILDIKHFNNCEWNDISFFDDAKHNFNAYGLFCDVIPNMKNMKFYRGEVDHGCVFWNEKVSNDLDQWYFQEQGILSKLNQFMSDNPGYDPEKFHN